MGRLYGATLRSSGCSMSSSPRTNHPQGRKSCAGHAPLAQQSGGRLHAALSSARHDRLRKAALTGRPDLVVVERKINGRSRYLNFRELLQPIKVLQPQPHGGEGRLAAMDKFCNADKHWHRKLCCVRGEWSRGERGIASRLTVTKPRLIRANCCHAADTDALTSSCVR